MTRIQRSTSTTLIPLSTSTPPASCLAGPTIPFSTPSPATQNISRFFAARLDQLAFSGMSTVPIYTTRSSSKPFSPSLPSTGDGGPSLPQFLVNYHANIPEILLTWAGLGPVRPDLTSPSEQTDTISSLKVSHDFSIVYARILEEMDRDEYQHCYRQAACENNCFAAFESRVLRGALLLEKDVGQHPASLTHEDLLRRAQNLSIPKASIAVMIEHTASISCAAQRLQEPSQTVAHTSHEASPSSVSGVDKLLDLAHRLFQQGTQWSPPSPHGIVKNKIHPALQPLLHTLVVLDPFSTPTCLLLACTYYAICDFNASLFWNKRCLELDAKCVEASCNMGHTLKVLRRCREAKTWWKRALSLRPDCWDAFESLLGLICCQAGLHQRRGNKSDERAHWEEALKLCEHVESHVLTSSPSDATFTLPSELRACHVPRLQQLFYAKGILKTTISGLAAPGCQEFMRGIELVVSPSVSRSYSFRDFIMAATVAVIVVQGDLAQPSILSALGLDPYDQHVMTHVATAQWHRLCPGGLLELAKRAGHSLLRALLTMGGGELPLILLLPDQVLALPRHLFSEYDGQLPAMARKTFKADEDEEEIAARCRQTTTTILSTLVKVMEDVLDSPPARKEVITIGGLQPSVALVQILHYLGISFHNLASYYSNLATRCASLAAVGRRVEGHRLVELSAAEVAMKWYDAGIELDPKCPHLVCNKASLLKDIGRLNEAMTYYKIAIDLQPKFAIALSNLGNVYRDLSRTDEAIEMYQRALEADPDMPEALCGLLNASLAVADWSRVYPEDGSPGLLARVANLVDRQLDQGAVYGSGALAACFTLEGLIDRISWYTNDRREATMRTWHRQLKPFFDRSMRLEANVNEGSFLLRLVDHLHRRILHRWYIEHFGRIRYSTRQERQSQVLPSADDVARYPRIRIPTSVLGVPSTPTVLPFHTFFTAIEGVMSTRALRLIAHRNAIRISHIGNTHPHLPAHIYPPPPPPAPRIKVGYLSSDIKDHPLSHLLQSMFSMHNRDQFEIFIYATNPSDHSSYRNKIEGEAEVGHFKDASKARNAAIIEEILRDGIHLLVNLNGYTKGAKNEIFASRVAPVQLHFMGFAGGMASTWTDYTIVDLVTCPAEVTSSVKWNERRRAGDGHRSSTSLPGEIDPEELSDEWVYTEKFIAMPHSYFVNNHKQDSREPSIRQGPRTPEELWEEEEERRWLARKELFPGLPDHFVCFASFNQHYKNTPALLKCWLKILEAVPTSILWLLEFPKAATPNILRDARRWSNDEVASRIIFTPIAPKAEFIRRARVADLVLDSFEVNAHTTACDALWSGTPVLTLPRWKMKQASMVASGVVMATGYGEEMVVNSEEAYVQRAIEFAKDLEYDYVDANGRVLQPIVPSAPIMASELTRFGPSDRMPTSSAVPISSSGPVDGQAVTGNGFRQASVSPSVSRSSLPGVSSSDAECKDVQDASICTSSATSARDREASLDARIASISPPRSTIQLVPGPQAPPGTASRRGHLTNRLTKLRRTLFLTRDSSPLFDTQKWVQDLERGYREAWERWVDGTDCEESPAWDALSGEDERRRRSGHIFVEELIRRGGTELK